MSGRRPLSKSVIPQKINIYIQTLFIKFHRKNIKNLVIIGEKFMGIHIKQYRNIEHSREGKCLKPDF